MATVEQLEYKLGVEIPDPIPVVAYPYTASARLLHIDDLKYAIERLFKILNNSFIYSHTGEDIKDKLDITSLFSIPNGNYDDSIPMVELTDCNTSRIEHSLDYIECENTIGNAVHDGSINVL